MSFTRRLAAGLPAASVTVLAALALTAAPAAATGDEALSRAKHPAVMTTPCPAAERGQRCDYAYGDEETPNGGESPNGGPTRGNGGYGSESPTVSPSTSPSPSPSTPTASVDTVPPGGESPAGSPPASPRETTPGGGVSPAGTLPLTGAPMGLTIALGALMVIGGGAAIYYSRRRRSA